MRTQFAHFCGEASLIISWTRFFPGIPLRNRPEKSDFATNLPQSGWQKLVNGDCKPLMGIALCRGAGFNAVRVRIKNLLPISNSPAPLERVWKLREPR